MSCCSDGMHSEMETGEWPEVRISMRRQSVFTWSQTSRLIKTREMGMMDGGRDNKGNSITVECR